MTDVKTTETPWECPVITGWMKNATLFGFVQINTQEPTLITASARMGMSYLVRQNNAKMDDIHE